MTTINKIQSYLTEHSLDAFLVLTKLNRQYVSGFTGSTGAVLISEKNAALYVDDRYTIRAKRESNLKVRALSSLSLDGRGQGVRVGIEDKITVRESANLKKNHKAKFITTSNIIEDLRAVKSTVEIRHIKKTQNIIDKIFSAIRKMKLVGMTELELSQRMERLAVKYGADGMAFESIVAFGANAAAPHHLSGKQKIKRGNFLLLDFGVLVNGYHSDFTRTLFIGSPSRRQEKVYNIVLEAQRRGIEAVRIHPHLTSPLKPTPKASTLLGDPGEGEEFPSLEGRGKGRVVASEVDKAARDYITKSGFGKYFTHNTGHGVGLEIHELPNFSGKSGDVLRPNMVVTVEPGIYIEGWGGVRIEDMVLVGDKALVLSLSPKSFEQMIIK